MKNATYYTVFCTVPDRGQAEKIAKQLVKEKLAACCNIVPGLTSVYRWQGEIQQDAELLLILKTTAAAMPALEKRIKELHSYEVPEIIALPILTGNSDYLNWIEENVQQ